MFCRISSNHSECCLFLPHVAHPTCSLPMSSEGIARCFVVYPPTIQNVCLFDFGFLNFRKWAVGDTLQTLWHISVPIKCINTNCGVGEGTSIAL